MVTSPPLPTESEPDDLKELLAKAGVDAQASAIATALQEVVIRELHHRVKNTLAIVSAITSQSLKTANSLEEAAKTIGDRLQALGKAQDLLMRERWSGAGCRTLIESAVKAFQSKNLDQFEIRGENIAISAGAGHVTINGHSRTLHECHEVWRAIGVRWSRVD